MKNKSFIVILAALLVLTTLAAVACGGNNDPSKEEVEHTHTFTEWETTTEPTCKAVGTKSRHCIICSETETEELPTVGHKYYRNKDLDLAATCYSEGASFEVCEWCLYTKKTVLQKKPHTYERKPDLDEKATCTKKGTEVSMCKVCGDKKEAEIPAKGHKHIDKYSDSYDGVSHHLLCSVCGADMGKESHSGTYDSCKLCHGEIYSKGLTFKDRYMITGIKNEDGTPNNGITDLVLTDSLTYGNNGYAITQIAENAFADCTKLKSVYIPYYLRTIGGGAFKNCPLESLNIPGSISEIGTQAFYGAKIKSITVDSNNSRYYAKNNCLIDSKYKTLLVGGVGSTIPDDGSVTGIDPYAFAGHDFTSITIPKTVTKIWSNVFDGCSDLTTVYYTGTQAEWDAIQKGENVIPTGVTLVCTGESSESN